MNEQESRVWSSPWSPRVTVVINRKASKKTLNRSQREGMKKRDILKRYPTEKATQLMKALKNKGLYYDDPDFPGDEEDWHAARKGVFLIFKIKNRILGRDWFESDPGYPNNFAKKNTYHNLSNHPEFVAGDLLLRRQWKHCQDWWSDLRRGGCTDQGPGKPGSCECPHVVWWPPDQWSSTRNGSSQWTRSPIVGWSNQFWGQSWEKEEQREQSQQKWKDGAQNIWGVWYSIDSKVQCILHSNQRLLSQLTGPNKQMQFQVVTSVSTISIVDSPLLAAFRYPGASKRRWMLAWRNRQMPGSMLSL